MKMKMINILDVTYLDVFEKLNMKFETNMKLCHDESGSSSSKSNETGIV